MNETQRKLLNKYLDGTCTARELEEIKTMLEIPGTEDMLHELMEERATSYETAIPDDALADKVILWEDQVINRITAASENPDTLHTIPSPKRFRLLRYAAIWAGIILLGGYTAWQIKKTNHQQPAAIAYIEQINQQAFPVQYTLPDSSVVYLGTGGKLRYPQQFTATTREISLSGQAFFDVKQDKARPFIVHTRSMQTRVLGTSFKIEAFENYPLVVSVATGKVSVSAVASQQAKELGTLIPGRKLTYDEATGTHKQAAANITGLQQWTSGDLVFDEQPLQLVMLELERRYGISTGFSSPKVAAYKVSGSFDKKENIRNILEMLSIIGNFRYQLKGNTVKISK